MENNQGLDLKEIAKQELANATGTTNGDTTIHYGEYKAKEEVPSPTGGSPTPIPVPVAPPTTPQTNQSAYIQQQGVETAESYRQKLINQGFSPEDADKAVLIWQSDKINPSPLQSALNQDTTVTETVEEKEPEAANGFNVVNITLPKSEVDKVEFTDDQKEKLVKSTSINFIVVEDKELATLKIDKSFDKKDKAAYLKKVEGALSQYAVPLIQLGDHVSFRGAQILQLHEVARAADLETNSIDAMLNTQASLIYDKIYNSNVIELVGDRGKTKMSYAEFLNIFPFTDIKMALYAIYCASSQDTMESTFKCTNCQKDWKTVYSPKSLLNTESMDDNMKAKMTEILDARNSPETLQDIARDRMSPTLIKSPWTKNVYEIGSSSVGKAMNLYKAIDQSDAVMVQNVMVGMFIRKINVYNQDNDSYIEVYSDETEIFLDTLLSLPDEDLQSLVKFISEKYIYTPQFVLESTCDHCQKKYSWIFSIEELVFLKARDSMLMLMN